MEIPIYNLQSYNRDITQTINFLFCLKDFSLDVIPIYNSKLRDITQTGQFSLFD